MCKDYVYNTATECVLKRKDLQMFGSEIKQI